MNADVVKVINRVRKVTDNQRIGVLATSMKGQAYASLMVYIIKEDLSQIIMVTRRNTRKFLELKSFPKVAFLIDTRSHTDVFFTATAVVTALGDAVEADIDDYPALSAKFIERHEHMAEFVNAEDTVFIMINVAQYDVVTDFESVKSLYVGHSDEGITYSVEARASY
ncbi:MAG: pyridoxamine 5'-phosphate oxidase family protein [bacterium]